MKDKIIIPTGWKKIKVYKAFEFLPTTSHSKGEMTYEQNDNSSVYNIHYGDIHSKYKTYIDFEKDKIPNLKDKKNGFERNLLKSGDLIMVDASEDLEGVGTCVEIKNLNSKKSVAGLHTFALRDLSNNTATGYRGLMLKHKAVRHRMQQVSTYSKVFGISKKSFSEIDLILPSLPEQEKIVKILEVFDECLEKLNIKIENKKTTKNRLLNSLIIKKKRLKGFSKELKISRLDSFIKVSSGYGFPLNLQGRNNEKYPFLKVSDMNLPGNEKTIKTWNNSVSKLDLLSLKAKVFSPNSVIFPKIGAAINTNKKRLIQIPCLVDNNVMVATPQNNCDPNFLYQWFLTINLSSWASSGGVPSIKKTDIEAHLISFPSIEEQTAIANILTAADEEIEALEKKKSIIEQQKKFLLNKLITGEIRFPEFIN